ncbi:unnamed protein product [Rotaria sp. Silwood1]|nr:unnamed protein product [Rotaria sp. Silwood1]CAF1266050.1 unnamed protein product [Rotaria sp. Silwood1]CAF1267982.1 unnamed protein product [Rotaria sp. Silwood1]CAF3521528.1 unnamed protein product [Rotaria sp. Silwood1]CAF3578718.1 unnamed protein product [Rotaria sp. Silwood1]
MVDHLFFYVNGKEILERNVEPEWNLLWYLRNKLRLTGSKLGCGEGGCGACTVLISRCIDRNSDEIEHRTINACLAPICSIDGCHVVTVEGLGSTNKSNLHSTQIRLAELFASQCGFCTPGMVMSLYGTVTSKHNSLPTMEDIEEGFDGNLCRCTGYRPILDAAKTFACDINKLDYQKSSSPRVLTTFDKCFSYVHQNTSSINQVPFPDKLRNYIPQSIHIKGTLFEWYRPISLDELIQLRHSYPGNQSKLIFGNTRVEFERKYNQMNYSRLISITHIRELQELKRTDDSLYIGAGVTFVRLKSKLTQWNNKDKFCQALLDQMKHFASTQIRNVASIGGNIISASPISDINPVLEAAGAILELHCADNEKVRQIQLCDFFLGNHHVSVADNEILVAIHIPLEKSSNQYFLRSYKQARRRDDSKGIVSAAFKVELEKLNSRNNQWKIISVCFSFGGIASKTISAKNTQQQLIGLSWTKQTINQAYELLIKEILLDELSPGGQIQYRRTLMQSFLFKFYSYVCNELRESVIDSIDFSYHRGISHGQQTIPERPQTQKYVGSSISHQSAYLHTTGEAIYVDDMPSHINTLYGALVLSTKANARIKHIDIDDASKVTGFVSFVNYIDVPGSNKLGNILPDEEIFVSSIAFCVGAIIGLVVCESEHAAKLAANLIKIDYDLLSPRIFSIEDAINHQSYFGNEICLQRGDVEKVFLDAEHVLEDILFIGGQEHFYMETQSCMVIPSNDDQEIKLYVGIQNPSTVQELIASVLGRDVNRITCHVKRVGGAFGGKETRFLPSCVAVAVAAVKLGRPVRLNLERRVDISITGHRHPFKIKYKIAFNNEGQFLGLDIQIWSNAGCTLDLSHYVMELAMLHMGNTYKFPNIRIRGRICKTHLPSNTAFRGFGGPQAMLACETIVEHIAAYLKCDPFTIRCLNLFKEGDVTHYGQILELWNVPRILDELTKSSDFIQRQINVKEFNRKNMYRKRGISMIPVKFGIGFTVQYLNQAGALVHIYKDGSVVISHGGVELGQGLHTKMIAIAAEILACDVDRIRISETATDKVHNSSPTVGSVSSDLNGMAVRHACEQIRQRLDTLIVDNNVHISWEDLIKQAYFARLDLCARGFYIIPNMFDADFTKNQANFNYFTQGAAVTEVELDVLTGDWHLLRVDILMDVGTSLNPHIDIGQIEGGFMQGIGLYTMEELIWGDEKLNKWIPPGELFTCGVDTYKIPSFSDVPIDFRVSLLSDSLNPRAIYSSKGIGEPPVLLAASAFFALKQACKAYREQQDLLDYFTLHSPATVERLRMVCADEFTQRACVDGYETFQPTGSY